MANSSIRLIKRLPKPERIFDNIQTEIARQLQPVGRQHVAERNKVVSDWDHQPKFTHQIKVSQKQVAMDILVTNDTEAVSDDFTIGDLWTSIDKTGTRPHPIAAKNAPRLAFQTNYQPHTRPIARSGGPGVATGPLVFPRQVPQHPGYPPRKFSEAIGKRLRRQFEQAIDRGIRLGARKQR